MVPRVRRACALACLPPALAIAFSGLFAGQVRAALVSDVELQIRQNANAPYVKLLLVDGRQAVGKFVHFVGDWRDSIASTVRYERWRSENGSGLPRIGDGLTLVTVSNDTLRGAFQGFAPDAVLLGSSNDGLATSVALGSVSAWLPDDSSDSSWPRVRERIGTSPTIAAVVLEQGTRHVVVTREQIVAAEGPGGARPAKSDHGPGWVPVVVIGLVAVVIVCAVAANDASNSINDSFSSCGNPRVNSASPAMARGGFTEKARSWRPSDTRRP